MRREAPQPWARAMAAQGYVYADRPSIRQLAAAARRRTGTDSPSDAAVHKVVMGEVADPEDTTVNALAAALELPAATVAGWVGQARQVSSPWVPPEGSDRLTRKQRDALDNLIRVMIERQGGDGDAKHAPSIDVTSGSDLTRPAGSPPRPRRAGRPR